MLDMQISCSIVYSFILYVCVFFCVYVIYIIYILLLDEEDEKWYAA